MNCIKQIRNEESLRAKLRENQYKYIFLQSPSLLKPDIYFEIYDTVSDLFVLCPQVEKVIFVTLNECISFPNYKCAKINNEIQCNIYQTCQAEHDTVSAITTRLADRLARLEVLPFSELKRNMEEFSFSKKDDIYRHPSAEVQEILARCFIIWISKNTSLINDEIFIQKMTNEFGSLSQEDAKEIIKSFINIIKNDE